MATDASLPAEAAQCPAVYQAALEQYGLEVLPQTYNGADPDPNLLRDGDLTTDQWTNNVGGHCIETLAAVCVT